LYPVTGKSAEYFVSYTSVDSLPDFYLRMETHPVPDAFCFLEIRGDWQCRYK